MLCKPCGNDHPFKGKFLEWNHGTVTIRIWSPCAPNDAYDKRFDVGQMPLSKWLNVDVFDIDPDLYVSVEAVKA